MKIFLIVMIMMGSQQLNEDLYIIQQPSFTSVRECIGYVQRNDLILSSKHKQSTQDVVLKVSIV